MSRLTVHSARSGAGMSRLTAHSARSGAGMSRLTAHSARPATGMSRLTAHSARPATGMSRLTARSARSATACDSLAGPGQKVGIASGGPADASCRSPYASERVATACWTLTAFAAHSPATGWPLTAPYIRSTKRCQDNGMDFRRGVVRWSRLVVAKPRLDAPDRRLSNSKSPPAGAEGDLQVIAARQHGRTGAGGLEPPTS